ncbi:AIPR family protein [Burkholderia gladioli]|uniref:AIPR family protein n=1 Tax=Burkholderia gladioli TaxID=28095 RepID=UPI003F79DBBB
MDVVTSSLLREFIHSQKLALETESAQFEAFVNYITISDIYPEEFDFTSIATGEGEFGLDGVAIIVNDILIDDEEQLDDLIAHAPTLNVQFIFLQAKSGSGFDGGEMLKFYEAVDDFFDQNVKFKQNVKIQELQRVKNRIYECASKFTRGLPKVSLYFASTGTWTDDQNLCVMRDNALKRLDSRHIFSLCNFQALDVSKVQKLYFQTKNSFKATIQFQQSLALPEIPKVRESYIGLLPINEYAKVITDDEGVVRRKLFFDNIRDFQGETDVNKSIAETLTSDEHIEFPLRNNGVTIVTRKLQRVGSQFTLEDFQIVNGCQTSHVVAASKNEKNAATLIPIKIIATEDEEVTRKVIIASNQQNRVDEDSFWALEPIQKAIEIYFESKSDDLRLYYERRPGQFNTMPGIEKVRIITKDSLLKNYASIFLEQPNQVGRYYKDLTPLIGKEIFNPKHEVHSYYTAAYIAYRLEFMFRNRRLAPELKPFRFQLAMAARLVMERQYKLDPDKKRSRAYCMKLDGIMSDVEEAQKVFHAAQESVHRAVHDLGVSDAGLDRRTAKMKDMRDKLREIIRS